MVEAAADGSQAARRGEVLEIKGVDTTITTCLLVEMKEIKHKTREEWLQAAVALMTPMFKGVGYDVPSIYVSAGWPSKGARSTARQTLGECWNKKASSDGKHQIFLNPSSLSILDHRAEGDKMGVLPTLVHEVVHAVVGCDQKHGKAFGKCARAVGLEGKLTSTFAGEDLYERCKQWSDGLGEYPHAILTPGLSGVKKQSTRMIKCQCGKCEYVCRTTKKWIDEAGAPLCPTHKITMNVEMPEEDDDAEKD